MLSVWTRLKSCHSVKRYSRNNLNVLGLVESKMLYAKRFKPLFTAWSARQMFTLTLNSFPNVKFKTSKLKEFADNNFKFDENVQCSLNG